MKGKIFLVFVWLIINPIYGQVSFGERVNIYDVDSLSTSVIYDDFDNDNDLDLIKCRLVNERNVLLQKNENGNLNSKLPTLISSDVSPIISLDINNDNFPDLITYHSYTTIGVLYNLQNDTFSDEQTLTSFTGSYSIFPIKFDYNSDGFIDLIVKNNLGKAYVLLNDQNGGFLPQQLLMTVGNGSANIYKIDDIDNDGDFDLYVSDGNLKIYINNNGTFVSSNLLEIYSNFKEYGIFDIDGNGYKDVLYLSNNTIKVKYFGFNQITNQFTVLNDVVVATNIPYYSATNNDSELFVKNTGGGIYEVYVALETALHQSNIYKLSISNGVFSAPQIVLQHFDINIFNLNSFKFLDFNNSGATDFVFSSTFNSQNMLLVNYDIDSLSDKTICLQQTINTRKFTVTDMDGDGTADVCVGQQNGMGYYKKMVNNEYGAIQNLIGVMSNPDAATYTLNYIMDFDNDGLGDIMDYSDSDMYTKVFKNLGNDNFSYVQNVSIPALTSGMSFADIDSDGYQDLLFQKNPFTTGNELMWTKNNNGINFGNVQPISFSYVHPVETVSLDFGDMNNNGSTDILMLSNYYSNDTYHYEVIKIENQGGIFSATSVAALTADYGTGIIKIKDMDQDGDLDFFVYDTSVKPFLFYRNDGQNNFYKIVIGNMNIHDIEFDDNDGDGKYEIYATNYNSDSYLGTIFYYRTSNFLNFTKFDIDSFDTYFQETADLLLFDYNGDDKKDLFVSKPNFVSGLVSVYINSSNPLSIEEVADSNNLKIFPNPFTNYVNWNGGNNKNYKLELYTLNGVLIHKEKTSNNGADLSFLSQGFYLLSIEDVDLHSKSMYKIIKQ